MRVGLLAAICTVISASPLLAGPGTVTFQGSVTNGDGTAVSGGNYKMRFSIFDAATVGTKKWEEIENAVLVTRGLFAAPLGDGTAFGSLFQNNTNLWLEVAVDLNKNGSFEANEIYTPRQKLAGAAWAADADTLDGRHAGSFWMIGGNGGTAPGIHFLGTTDNKALDLRVNNARAFRLEPNAESPNVIGGHSDNNVMAGMSGATIGGGGKASQYNQVIGDLGTVGGGGGNTAGQNGTVGGGIVNTAGVAATVGGGVNNQASGESNTIGGGSANWTSALRSTVAGGYNNTTLGNYSAVGGGILNTAGALGCTIAGGQQNNSTDTAATIGGGHSNLAFGAFSTVAGGYRNRSKGNWATVCGGWNNASYWYAAVCGGQDNAASATHAVVGGGHENVTTGSYAFVGGGTQNRAPGQKSVIGGGELNRATATGALVAGGYNNIASDTDASVLGGYQNQATRYYAAVAGGFQNTAGGPRSFVGSGAYNTASGTDAAVPGGMLNAAGGQYSFAAGYRAKANNIGSFAWADSVDQDFAVSVNNRFGARATGGVYFYTNSALTAGARLAAGGSSWGVVSDRSLKENLRPVDGREVLEKLAAIPLTTWNYKSEEPGIRHLGPMAQDLYAAFALGDSEKIIYTIDADGVALAAVQGLYNLLQERNSQILAQQERIGALEQRNRDQEARLAALEAAVAKLARPPAD